MKCLAYFLVFATQFLHGNPLAAKEPQKDESRKNARRNTTADLDVITPFDGNRIFNYVVNDGSIVTDNFGGGSGLRWPSVPRTSRHQKDEDLRSEKAADYSSGLWVAGMVNGQLRSAIAEYSSEYVAGKILPNGTRDDPALPKYRVYKIMRGDGPGVKDWDEWPAADGAPVNADGTPRLFGDQTLWYVVNDLDARLHQNGPIEGSAPIGLEVQVMVFGYNREGPLGDMMFAKWRIINKGAADLDCAYAGLWDDPDLGDASDDLVGCDIALNLGYCYNGDSYDGAYGTNTPAIGSTFLQGPEVPAGSGNFLKMTAFVGPFKCCPSVRGSQPQNVPEVYNCLKGLWTNGDPYFNPVTGEVSTFMLSGDPVTQSGDLDIHPSDRRFIISSGPFQIAAGDTQEIVAAKIMAPGPNPASSIRALRLYQSYAQGVYDADFLFFSPPSPKVVTRRLPQEISLTWLQDHEALEAFTQAGYKFQGYRVYQGASMNGPFTALATFDVVDGIQDIFDYQFDEATGRVLEKLVVAGSDAGIQRYLSIKTDAIHYPGQKLSNYMDYYFAVTGYAVNMEVAPKVLESPMMAFRVAPSATDYGVSVESPTGTRADMQRDKTAGLGEFFYQVVDPALIPAATYRVTWNDDSTPALGAYTWNLDRGGERVLSQQPISGPDREGNPQNDAPVVDGLQIQILPKSFLPPRTYSSFRAISQNGSLQFWGDARLIGQPTGYYNEFGNGVPTPPAAVVRSDLEFRFNGVSNQGNDNNDAPIDSGGQWTTQWERAVLGEPDLSAFARVQMRAPFELWDVENNRQVSFAIINRNADGQAPYGDGVGDPAVSGSAPRYRMSGRDYIIPIMTPYTPATAASTLYSPNDASATWMLFFYHGGSSVWHQGDTLHLTYDNPTQPAVDEYTFTTTAGVRSGQRELAQRQLQSINIVPNPYWGFNKMERDPGYRFVRITNLPGQGAKVRIFTLSGDLVRVIDDADRSAEGTQGLQYVDWDLKNDSGRAVASGVYLIYVDVPQVGTTVKKAMVIMPVDY